MSLEDVRQAAKSSSYDQILVKQIRLISLAVLTFTGPVPQNDEFVSWTAIWINYDKDVIDRRYFPTPMGCNVDNLAYERLL